MNVRVSDPTLVLDLLLYLRGQGFDATYDPDAVSPDGDTIEVLSSDKVGLQRVLAQWPLGVVGVTAEIAD
jgi:hypothetical protein